MHALSMWRACVQNTALFIYCSFTLGPFHKVLSFLKCGLTCTNAIHVITVCVQGHHGKGWVL